MIYKNYIFMTTDKDRPKKRRVEISVPDVRDRKAVSKALAAAAPDRHVLEISNASSEKVGKALSAFNLRLRSKELSEKFGVDSATIECIFQGSKVFEQGGPYDDLYTKTSLEAKKDPRLRNSGRLVGFSFMGRGFPTTPKTAFYDWLYHCALFQNKDLWEQARKYDAFTDVMFDPDRSLNCQAAALARINTMFRNGKLDNGMLRFDDFVKAGGYNDPDPHEQIQVLLPDFGASDPVQKKTDPNIVHKTTSASDRHQTDTRNRGNNDKKGKLSDTKSGMYR